MEESMNIINYKWNNGVYSLKDLIILVEYKKITQKQFFEITRINYKGLLERKTKEEKEISFLYNDKC